MTVLIFISLSHSFRAKCASMAFLGSVQHAIDHSSAPCTQASAQPYALCVALPAKRCPLEPCARNGRSDAHLSLARAPHPFLPFVVGFRLRSSIYLRDIISLTYLRRHVKRPAV